MKQFAFMVKNLDADGRLFIDGPETRLTFTKSLLSSASVSQFPDTTGGSFLRFSGGPFQVPVRAPSCEARSPQKHEILLFKATSHGTNVKFCSLSSAQKKHLLFYNGFADLHFFRWYEFFQTAGLSVNGRQQPLPTLPAPWWRAFPLKTVFE